MPTKPAKPKLDRFGTLKQILLNVPRLKACKVNGVAGGYAAALAAVAFWDAADARTGKTVMTVSRLAGILGSTRATARRSIAVLRDLKLVKPFTKPDGTLVAGRWHVRHLERGEDG